MFGWYDKDKSKLRIAYLFLSSENRINDADYSLFEKIGESIKDFSNIKGEIIGECEKILVLTNNSKLRFEIVSEVFSSYKTSDGSNVYRNCDILWTLLGLHYRNKEKSEREQQLIDLFAEANYIDKSIVLEMRDTCETLNTVINYKKWLSKNKSMTLHESEPIMQELDKDMKNLQQSAIDLITLG
jgi:hypothetical protein